MIQIQWQDRLLTTERKVKLTVRRIVFRTSDGPVIVAIVRSIADAAELEMANEQATPQAGDFWLGCSPRLGWGQTDPDLIGWACSVEVSLALSVLRAAVQDLQTAARQRRFETQRHQLLAVGS
ncbi:MAG: hypothetical protein C0467_18570 [Planctomycetaceae bacterium]|nr:hypothetical protein [Planctomycetaceae bacterium]